MLHKQHWDIKISLPVTSSLAIDAILTTCHPQDISYTDAHPHKTRSFQRCSENVSIFNWCFYSKLWSPSSHGVVQGMSSKQGTMFAALEPLFSNQTSVGTPQRFSTCNLRLLWQPERASNIITNQSKQLTSTNPKLQWFWEWITKKASTFAPLHSSALFNSQSSNSKFN